MIKRKVRKDFDRTQPIIVDVSNSSVEEKKKVQQAFFDIGIKWVFGETYELLEESFYTNVTSEDDVISSLMWGDRENICSIVEPITPKDFFKMVYEDEDKEMEGYTKEVKGLDDILPIIVDMSMSSLVEQIKVQQSLYDISLNRVTRSEEDGFILVKADDLNSFKWVLKDTSKEVYIEFIKRGVLVEAFHNFEIMDFCHNFWGRVVSAGIHDLDKYKDKGCKEVFFQDGEFYTKNNAIDFNYEEYCKGGYVATTRGGLDVTQIKKLDVSCIFPVVGVINGEMIQTWTEGGSMSPFNHENEGDLVMYKV